MNIELGSLCRVPTGASLHEAITAVAEDLGKIAAGAALSGMATATAGSVLGLQSGWPDAAAAGELPPVADLTTQRAHALRHLPSEPLRQAVGWGSVVHDVAATHWQLVHQTRPGTQVVAQLASKSGHTPSASPGVPVQPGATSQSAIGPVRAASAAAVAKPAASTSVLKRLDHRQQGFVYRVRSDGQPLLHYYGHLVALAHDRYYAVVAAFLKAPGQQLVLPQHLTQALQLQAQLRPDIELRSQLDEELRAIAANIGADGLFERALRGYRLNMAAMRPWLTQQTRASVTAAMRPVHDRYVEMSGLRRDGVRYLAAHKAYVRALNESRAVFRRPGDFELSAPSAVSAPLRVRAGATLNEVLPRLLYLLDQRLTNVQSSHAAFVRAAQPLTMAELPALAQGPADARQLRRLYAALARGLGELHAAGAPPRMNEELLNLIADAISASRQLAATSQPQLDDVTQRLLGLLVS